MKISNTLPKVTFGGIMWVLMLALLAYRIGPQVRAAFGAGAGDEAMPAFALASLDGDTISTASLRGKVVLVNFWATWCPPCRFEMPGFQRVYEDKRDEGFLIVGISTDQGGERAVRQFLEERGITYPVMMAARGVVADFGGVRALPTSFLVDRNGVVRQEVSGIFAEPTLRMAVNRLLAEPAASAPAGGGAE